VLFSGASDEIPDRQGRITMPAALREYAGLDREVVVVGNGTTVEIWDATSWETYLGNQEEGFSDISEEVVPGIL
jgi:MraZ protein